MPEPVEDLLTGPAPEWQVRDDQTLHDDQAPDDEQTPGGGSHRVLRTADQGDRWAWRARVRANPVALFWYRLGVGVLGLLLMISAALTGWLPGPGGIPLFLVGLAVWASEFVWAQRILHVFKAWFDRLKALDPRVKRLFWTGVVLAVLGTWYGAAVMMGLPSWLPQPVVEVLQKLPGIRPA